MNKNIIIAKSAAEHINKILTSEPKAIGVRLSVKNAGCSGKSYMVDFAYEQAVDDLKFSSDGVNVLVDKKSLIDLKGTEIYCKQEGLNKYLKFKNPNAVGECGCGESFQVKE